MAPTGTRIEFLAAMDELEKRLSENRFTGRRLDRLCASDTAAPSVASKAARSGYLFAISLRAMDVLQDLALRPTKLPWGHSKRLTKMTREVTLVRETSGERDLRQ